jgi:hypothetical protein
VISEVLRKFRSRMRLNRLPESGYANGVSSFIRMYCYVLFTKCKLISTIVVPARWTCWAIVLHEPSRCLCNEFPGGNQLPVSVEAYQDTALRAELAGSYRRKGNSGVGIGTSSFAHLRPPCSSRLVGVKQMQARPSTSAHLLCSMSP